VTSAEKGRCSLSAARLPLPLPERRLSKPLSAAEHFKPKKAAPRASSSKRDEEKNDFILILL
jgi:hypothetical protein